MQRKVQRKKSFSLSFTGQPVHLRVPKNGKNHLLFSPVKKRGRREEREKIDESFERGREFFELSRSRRLCLFLFLSHSLITSFTAHFTAREAKIRWFSSVVEHWSCKPGVPSSTLRNQLLFFLEAEGGWGGEREKREKKEMKALRGGESSSLSFLVLDDFVSLSSLAPSHHLAYDSLRRSSPLPDVTFPQCFRERRREAASPSHNRERKSDRESAREEAARFSSKTPSSTL